MCPRSLLLPLLIVMISVLKLTQALAIPIPTALDGTRWGVRTNVVSAHVCCQGSPTGEDPAEEVLLQEELDAMMGTDRLAEENLPVSSRNYDDNDDSNENQSLYNAAPLVSGVLITGFSVFLTFYGFYAGLSGTDPLFQQYPPIP
jgi:hypothetical protein